MMKYGTGGWASSDPARMRAADDPTRGRGHTNELVRVGAKEHGCETDCDVASVRLVSAASG